MAGGSWIRSKQCVPQGFSCAVPAPSPKPTVLINELLADPPPVETGDLNGDGLRDAVADEFVEIVNHGDSAVDLGNFSLADSVGTRFEFPHGTSLMPGEAVLVFGGGDPDQFADFGDVLVLTAKNGLGLNNRGDTITLSDLDGETVDEITYGREGGRDVSLVRENDGDKEAPFVENTAGVATPGTKQDGSPF